MGLESRGGPERDVGPAFDRLAAAVDPAMVIVTASLDGNDAGCLVGFHGQSSIDPRRWSVWISRANHSHDIIVGASRIGVHFLADGDHELARLFGATTGDEIDKFARCETVHRLGVPMLADCGSWLVGTRCGRHTDGDHTCVVVEPLIVGDADLHRPLRLADVDDVEPGHPVDGR
ncbi:MAG: flavin reductase family protein [Acidimicrobiales bacterium]